MKITFQSYFLKLFLIHKNQADEQGNNFFVNVSAFKGISSLFVNIFYALEIPKNRESAKNFSHRRKKDILLKPPRMPNKWSESLRWVLNNHEQWTCKVFGFLLLHVFSKQEQNNALDSGKSEAAR